VAVPVVIVALNWRWIFDDLSGFLNNFLITTHLSSNIISWLSDPGLPWLRDRRRRVGGHAVLLDDLSAGLQAIPRRAVRGRRDRRRLDRPGSSST